MHAAGITMEPTVGWGGTHLVTERGVVEGVQLVGDVFADKVPEHLVEESV